MRSNCLLQEVNEEMKAILLLLAVIIMTMTSLSVVGNAEEVWNVQVGPYNISFDKSLLDVWTSSSSVYPLYVTNPLGDVNYALYPIWIIGESGIMFIGIFDYVEPEDTDLTRAHFDIASQLWKLGYDEVGWVLPQIDGAPGIAVTGIDKNNELGFGAAYWKDEDTYVKILGRFFKEGAAGDVYEFLETIHIEELRDEP